VGERPAGEGEIPITCEATIHGAGSRKQKRRRIGHEARTENQKNKCLKHDTSRKKKIEMGRRKGKEEQGTDKYGERKV